MEIRALVSDWEKKNPKKVKKNLVCSNKLSQIGS